MCSYQVNIIKSWRKSLSLRFDKHGVLQVRAPKFVWRSQIDVFIAKNASWIEKQQLKREDREKNKKHYLFWEELETSLLNSLSSEEREAAISSFPWGEELRWGFVGQNKQNLEKLYKKEAKKYIIPRCNELAEKHGFTHTWIRITSATTRWGSCSSKKTLNFSYRLVMSPRDTIDYVIIHELCHLRQMNHSHKFWKEVSDIMPEYKVHEKHLKDEGWKYVI